jgi:threonine synthase
MNIPSIICTNCGRNYPATGSPYRCIVCGGVYDYRDPIKYDPNNIDLLQPGIWKYRNTFNFDDEVDAISLGEGDTPLIWTEMFGHTVALKCEYLNPSGSFKDRGSSLIASFLRSRKIDKYIEDSSGNAGASLAAYSARAGIELSVVIPEIASGIKRKQIEAYGARLIPVNGTRSEVHDAAKRLADSGNSYASHAYLPFNIPGYATVAYEIFEQIGNNAPGTVIVPVGQGGLLIGIARGFAALMQAGKITKVPSIVGVQARACAPIWSIFKGGIDGLRFSTDGPTLAEGVRVWQPIRGDSVLKEIGSSSGKVIAVDENEIQIGVEEFSRRGFHIEPTSALVWNALMQCVDECEGPIVVVLTGSGLKHQAIF